MRHPLLLLSLLPLLLGTSCSLLISFFIANVSSRPIHIEYTVPCRPDCPSPTLIGVRTLKHDGLSGTIHGDRPAPARVQGRVDSLITYSLDLLPDTAIRIFDGSADFGAVSAEVVCGSIISFIAVSPISALTRPPGALRRSGR